MLALNPMTAVIAGFQWGVIGTRHPSSGRHSSASARLPCSSLSGCGISVARNLASRTRSDERMHRHVRPVEEISHRRAPQRLRHPPRLARRGRSSSRPPGARQLTSRRSGLSAMSRSRCPRAKCWASSARNGAGKSTLLRILTRITTPTSGRAEIRGRVGSLLEVGTGFHPELTGRENVFLNGSVLGMKRQEIQTQVRRDRRVLGCRAVHRHARQALLEWNGRAAGVRRSCSSRARDPPRRRGARGRRCRVPAALPRRAWRT